jgi:hypothetical protein
MTKYLLLKHYRGVPASVNDVPMDQWTPEELSAHVLGGADRGYALRWIRTSENTVLRLSEKSRMHPRRGPAGHRKGVFQPISSSAYWPNPCSERCSYPLFGQSQKVCSRKFA